MSQQTYKDLINTQLRQAMKEKDKIACTILRLVMNAIKNAEKEAGELLSDSATLSLIQKMVKQGEQAAAQYQEAGREDLYQKEQSEVRILQGLLPTPLTAPQITTLIESAIKEANASTIKDMGRVMKTLQPQLAGRADMSQVSLQVKDLLK